MASIDEHIEMAEVLLRQAEGDYGSDLLVEQSNNLVAGSIAHSLIALAKLAEQIQTP
jgi:hypothetical protein